MAISKLIVFSISCFYSIPFVPKEEGYPTSAYRGANQRSQSDLWICKFRIPGTSHSQNRKFANVEYTAPFLKGLKQNMFISWDWQDLAENICLYILSMPMILPPKSYSYVQGANLLEQMVTYTRVTKNHNKYYVRLFQI